MQSGDKKNIHFIIYQAAKLSQKYNLLMRPNLLIEHLCSELVQTWFDENAFHELMVQNPKFDISFFHKIVLLSADFAKLNEALSDIVPYLGDNISNLFELLEKLFDPDGPEHPPPEIIAIALRHQLPNANNLKLVCHATMKKNLSCQTSYPLVRREKRQKFSTMLCKSHRKSIQNNIATAFKNLCNKRNYTYHEYQFLPVSVNNAKNELAENARREAAGRGATTNQAAME